MLLNLKDIIKGPFRHDDCPCGDVYCNVGEKGMRRVLQIRGWGTFQNYPNGEQLQDDFKNWVIKVLNEAVERDFKEPKQG